MRICQELLSYHVSSKAKAVRISRALNYDYPSHSYPITAREARRLGLNIRELDPAGGGSAARSKPCRMPRWRRRILTDFDTLNHHNTEICNILEILGRQVVLPGGQGLALPEGGTPLGAA